MQNKQTSHLSNYTNWLKELKEKVRLVQLKAAVRVNTELLGFYWSLGRDIVEKQKSAKWGDGFLKQLSQDLTDEFPDMKGFSKRNLELMRKWYLFWSAPIAKQSATQLLKTELKQHITQIPWWHNVVILTKCTSYQKALFYVQKTIENSWSRSVLTYQIERGLYEKVGKAITNFDTTLPKVQSDLAKQTLKDPYCFDFLTITEKLNERDLELGLTNQITNFLLELGTGFSFIGRQYKLVVGGEEFLVDLLFYQVKLHSYVVIELKTGKFKPEYAGKLNFYISAIDETLKNEQDNPTIGLMICKSKNNIVVEYALKDISKPIGVSEYSITKTLPDTFKSTLPSIRELEDELTKKERR